MATIDAVLCAGKIVIDMQKCRAGYVRLLILVGAPAFGVHQVVPNVKKCERWIGQPIGELGGRYQRCVRRQVSSLGRMMRLGSYAERKYPSARQKRSAGVKVCTGFMPINSSRGPIEACSPTATTAIDDGSR